VPDDESLIDPKEVAKRLKVNVRAVLRMAKRREIIAYRVETHYRFKPEDFEDYLERHPLPPHEHKGEV